MRINIAGSGHVAPIQMADVEWKAFDKQLARQKAILERAIEMLKRRRSMKSCNEGFSKLPNGKSFDQVLDDNDIWVSYCSSTTSLGTTEQGTKEITIFEKAFQRGVTVVASTLLHEMAHVNGASQNGLQAEGTLLCCGFSKEYDKENVGSLGSESSTKMV